MFEEAGQRAINICFKVEEPSGLFDPVACEEMRRHGSDLREGSSGISPDFSFHVKLGTLM